MAKDVIITPLDGDIQFKNSSGNDSGKIEQSGDDLVLTNAVGDVLIGDGASDVFVGDGTNSVDIIFEQPGSVKGLDGSSVDLTIGSYDTDLTISGSTLNIQPAGNTTVIGGPLTVTKVSSDQNTAQDSGTIPATTLAETIKIHGGSYTNGQYTTEIVKVDRSGNLPLYVRQSKGTANSFTNLIRIGDHGQTNGTDIFAVFGKARVDGQFTVTGGSIVLGGTGRIQGIDTVSANTDAANKLYVDNSVPTDFVSKANGGTFSNDIIVSGSIYSTSVIYTDEIRDRTGQDLTITAGEASGHLTQATHNDEIIRLAAESGVKVYSSTDNLSSGLNKVTTLIDSSGHMSIAGDLTVGGGDISLSGTGRIQGIDTVSSNTDAANKLYVDNAVGNYLPLGGGTVTGNITISKDNPVLILSDTTSTSNANQVAYISFQDNGSEEAWIGWGSSGNSDFTINNSIGSVVLNGNGTTQVSDNLSVTGTGAFGGDLTVDAGTSTTLWVKCDDGGNAIVRASGEGQGTGVLEVGQSTSYGGGISYNGDSSPAWASGETSDYITFYRLDNGTRTEVFNYPYNSNTVTFNGDINVNGGDIVLGGTGRIQGIDTVSSGTDAANKTYVDNAVAGNTNADTVDNLHAASFFRSDAADSAIGFASTTSVNGTGDAGLSINNGGRLGFDQSGTRSWTVKAASGQLQFASGDNGGSFYFGSSIVLNNKTITGIDSLSFNDPGPLEGISWSGGNFKIYESPDDLTTNTAGNLQFVSGSTRVVSIGKVGETTLQVIGSGSTVLDIQGSQGQLFSVTDDLTGDLFSVSDISGVPILNVNASGHSYFDGTLDLSGSLQIAQSSATSSIWFNAEETAGILFRDNQSFDIGDVNNGDNVAQIHFRTMGNQILSLDDGEVFFKGDVEVGTVSDNYRLSLYKADNNVSDHLQFYIGSTRMGEIGSQDTTWLRINQVTNKNIYTPRYIRADAGLFVDDTNHGINGSGVLTDASLQGTYTNALTFSNSSNDYGATVHNVESTLTSGDWNNYVDGTESGWSGVNNHSGANRPSNGNATAYTYGLQLFWSRSGEGKFQIYAPEQGTAGNNVNQGIWFRTGWSSTYRAWAQFLDTTARDQLVGGKFKVTTALGVGVAASSTTGRIDASNDVVAYSTSDERLKENVKPIKNALDKVSQIQGIEFDWKPLSDKEKKTIHGNEGHDVGVIAQEVESVLPEVVQERDNGYKAVRYEKLVPLLIESIKEQQSQIEELKAIVDKLQNEK